MSKLSLTEFERSVLAELKNIPLGRVTTYQNLAKRLGKPNAARAVGNALNKNPQAPQVPCHRVVKSNGEIGGYAFGTEKKIKLLKKEGVTIKGNKIVDFEKKNF